MRKLAEVPDFNYQRQYVKGQRLKGIAISRELIEKKLLTVEDILVKNEEEIEGLIVNDAPESTEDAVVGYLAGRWGVGGN